jgi:peptidoglycan endopeptidase LytE
MIPPAPVEGARPRSVRIPVIAPNINELLLTAIQSHLGASYHYTATGPNSFDCSGFVWRSFQEAGLNFTRGPARSYWATFAAPPKEEQFKFGTLVFFSGLTHIGIVADEKGFYHSSRHHGVVYSPFNDYWLSRIDGFRRVPLESTPAPPNSAKSKAGKPATSTPVADEDNEP